MGRGSETLHGRTLCGLRDGLARRDFSSVELTEALLARISDVGQPLNAFITVTAEQALAQARDADRLLSSGRGLKR